MKNYNNSTFAVILFFASSFIVLIISIYTNVMINSISVFLKDNIEMRLLATAMAAAKVATAEELARLAGPADMDSPLYADIRKRLISFADENRILYAITCARPMMARRSS